MSFSHQEIVGSFVQSKLLKSSQTKNFERLLFIQKNIFILIYNVLIGSNEPTNQ
jgi:hypothetical protein